MSRRLLCVFVCVSCEVMPTRIASEVLFSSILSIVLPTRIDSIVLPFHIVPKVKDTPIASTVKHTHIILGKQQMKVTTPEGNKAGIVKAVCRFINCKDVVDYEVGTVGRLYPL